MEITTLARGVAVGDELQYADELTLIRSLSSACHTLPPPGTFPLRMTLSVIVVSYNVKGYLSLCVWTRPSPPWTGWVRDGRVVGF